MTAANSQFPAVIQSEVVQRLSRYFEDSIPQSQAPVSRKELVELLAAQIQRLLHQDPERLAQALYRVDVKEEKVNSAFGLRVAGDIAMRLAELVVEKEEEKAAFREKFNSSPRA